MSLALTFCGNCCCEPLARDVFPEIVPFMHHENLYIRKKVCLSMIKIVTVVPELTLCFKTTPLSFDVSSSYTTLLLDNDHGVLISGFELYFILFYSNATRDLDVATSTQLHSEVPQNGSQFSEASSYGNRWEWQSGMHGGQCSGPVRPSQDASIALFAL